MKVSKNQISSGLLDEPVSLSQDYPICHRCFQAQFDGFCACDEPADDSLAAEAAEWLTAGVSAEEMAAAGIVLEVLGQRIVPAGIHFDIAEDLTLMAAAGECAETAAAMRMRQQVS